MILAANLATGTTLAALAFSLILIITLFVLRFRRNLLTFKKSYDEILLDEYGYVERLVNSGKVSPEFSEDYEAPPTRIANRGPSRIAKNSDLLNVEYEMLRQNQENAKILAFLDDCLFSLKKAEKGAQVCQNQRRVLEEKYTLMESTVRVLTGMKDLKGKSIYKFVVKSVIGAIILIAAFYILVFTDLSESLKSSTIALITTVAGFLLGKFT